MRRILLVFVAVFAMAATSIAQLIKITPEFPTDTSPLSIIVDATKGNQGLLNYANTNDVYVHVGLITNLSANNSDWKYVKFAWGTTDPNAKATLMSPNKYRFDIPNIRTFFGVPAGETIRKVAILFRNGSGSQVQRNADASIDNGNMY